MPMNQGFILPAPSPWLWGTLPWKLPGSAAQAAPTGPCWNQTSDLLWFSTLLDNKRAINVWKHSLDSHCSAELLSLPGVPSATSSPVSQC